MENKDLIVEVELLLSESEELLAQGNTDEAAEKIAEAKDKLRPIGSGTNGPEPKE